MMSEECLGCEWYNKPYWSIISPCTNCPKRFKNNTIKVTKYSINIDKTDLYKRIEELQQQNQKYKEVIDNINLIIKGLAYGGNEDYYMEKFRKINEILKGEDNE